jgi:outer membrane lipase/esterase
MGYRPDIDIGGNEQARLTGVVEGYEFTAELGEPVAFAQVYVDGAIPGTIDGRDDYNDQTSLFLPIELQGEITSPGAFAGDAVISLEAYGTSFDDQGYATGESVRFPEAGEYIDVDIDGATYRVEFLGYSNDGGATILSDFFVPNDQAFDGELFAVFTLVDGPALVIPVQPPVESTSPTQEQINEAMGGIATSTNTSSTASVIAIACPVANSDKPGSRFTRDCNNLVGVGAFAPEGSEQNNQAIAALDTITPEQATAPLSSSRDSLGTQLRNVSTRLAALRGGAVGLSLQGLPTGASLGDAFGSEMAGLTSGLANATGGAASGDASNSLIAFGDGRVGVFLNGSLSSGDKDATDNEDGFSFDGWGLTGGIDYRFTDDAILGLAAGYNSSSTDIDDNGGSLDADGWSISLYGTYYPDEHFYADAIVTYGSNSYDQDRNIRYSIGDYSVNQTASADYDSTQWSATLGGGYDIPRGSWTFTPVVQLQYLSADVDGYTERMSAPNAPGGGWATRLGDVDQESLTSMLGFNVSHALSTNWGVVSPQLHLGWVHEYEDDAIALNGSFVDDPTSGVFGVQSDRPDSDYFNMRLGVSAQLAQGNSLFLYYNKVVGYRNLDLDSLGAGVRLTF